MPLWLAAVLLALAASGIVLCRKYLCGNKPHTFFASFLFAAGAGLHRLYWSDPSLCRCRAKSAACINRTKHQKMKSRLP